MTYDLDARYSSDLGAIICSDLGLETKGKISGRIMTHHEDHGHKTPCMLVDLDKNFAKCFSCGFSRSLTGMYWDKFEKSAYIEYGRGRLEESPNPFNKGQPEPEVNFDDSPGVDFAFDGSVVPAKHHPLGKKFLLDRGLSSEVADEARIQVCLKGFTYLRSDPRQKIYFTERLIVPVYEGGKLLALEGRDLKGEDDWRKRMAEAGKNPDESTYKKVLYPRGSSVDTLWRMEKLRKNETLYVAEGILDAASLMTCERTRNATSLFHAIPTERQLYLLDKFEDVVYVPDMDETGFRALRALKKEGPRIKVLFLPKAAGIKDISDVQQGRNKRFNSVSALVGLGWLEKAEPLSKIDVDERERILLG